MSKITHTATKKRKPERKNTKPDEIIKLNRIGRLRNSKEIGRFVSRMIHLAAKNQKRGGDVVNNVYKLVTCASMLAKIIEGDELKQRVKELEGLVSKGKNNENDSPKSEPVGKDA
jgi:hypothetical protein